MGVGGRTALRDTYGERITRRDAEAMARFGLELVGDVVYQLDMGIRGSAVLSKEDARELQSILKGFRALENGAIALAERVGVFTEDEDCEDE